MSAEAQIKLQVDRWAKLRQGWIGGVSGDTFYTKADAAADSQYENHVKGWSLTRLDTALAAGALGTQENVRNWFALHLAYFTAPTTAYEPGLGLTGTGWDAYLALKGWRVPHEFAELHYDCYGQRISSQYIFPKGTWAANIGVNATAGLHKFGDVTRGASSWPAVLSNADGLIPSTVKGSPIIIVSAAGAAATALTVNAVLQDRVTAKAVALTGLSLTANTQVVVGQQAVGAAGAASGQKDVPMAATGQFTAAEWVLIVEGAVEEVAQIDSITANTKLTMETNLINTFTGSAVVWPLFTNVSGISAVTGGSQSEVIYVYARPDRAIAL
jgi:hypothetical protein